jgi:hypothetical protein
MRLLAAPAGAGFAPGHPGLFAMKANLADASERAAGAREDAVGEDADDIVAVATQK